MRKPAEPPGERARNRPPARTLAQHRPPARSDHARKIRRHGRAQRRPLSHAEAFMNSIIYVVGLIVVILVILSFLGLR